MIGIEAFYAEGCDNKPGRRAAPAPRTSSLRSPIPDPRARAFTPRKRLAPVPRESSVTKAARRVAAPWLLVNRL